MLRLGFLGTGSLASAIVDGLNRVKPEELSIALSPRSAATASDLAVRYGNVERLTSNASVVNASDIVFLGVRPDQFRDAVSNLPFRAEQIVVSLVAGVPLVEVRRGVQPASDVYRVMTVPTVRLGRGPLLAFPCLGTAVADVLGRLGDLICVEDEEALVTISNASGTMSTYFGIQAEIATWIARREVSRERAQHFVASLFDGLAAVALHDSAAGSGPVLSDYETKGGLNEHCRASLMRSGWFAELSRGLDAIEHRQAGMVLGSASPS